MDSVIKPIAIILLVILLQACSSDITHVHLQTSQSINRAYQKQTLPVLVKVYELQSSDSFKHASFQQIWHHDVDTLQTDMLSKARVLLAPGANRHIDLAHHEQGKFIAVAAIFHDPNSQQWRAVIKEPKRLPGITPTVYVTIDKNTIQFQAQRTSS